MRRRVLLLAACWMAVVAPLAGCGSPTVDQPFELLAVPRELKGASIAGQRVVYLVTADGAGEAPVVVTGRADGAGVRVEGADLGPGGVAEVVVTPDAASVGGRVSVTIEGTRGGASDSLEVSFEVLEGVDDRAPDADRLRDRFVAWLEANRPELGITSTTPWDGTIVSPQWLVVSHYLFFSPDWEMHVSWHIMIAPDDWSRVDLRRRFHETLPSLAFEIPSVSQGLDPRPSEVPGELWR